MAIDPRIALQVRAPDLGGAISQGLQNASGFQQLQHFKQDRESDKLLGLAMGGDNSALERLKVAAPKKYVAARKTMNDLDAGERDAAAKSYAQTVVQASGLLAQGNQQGVIDLLSQRSADLEASGRDNSHTLRGLQLAQAGQWDQLKSVLNEEATGLERLGYLKAPRAEKTEAATELQKLIAARDALPPNDPNRQAYNDRIAKITQSSNGISIDAEGNVQIGGPAKEMQSTNVKEAEARVVGAGESLARLQTIKENYKPVFLTYGGRWNNLVSNIKSKAGFELTDEDRDLLRQRRRFTQGINTEFNAYRKMITGAAASVQELTSLKDAMISDDLSPDAFESAFDEYSSELSRSIRIRNKLLREGLQPGTKQFGSNLDNLFISGGDDTDFEARGDELEEQGMPADKIVDTLEQEGYL